MALINSGQIELLDLTDTRAAILTLNTSLPKLQVQQSDGNFSPDFEKSSGKVPEYDPEGFPTGNNREAEQGLHIYPSLYFGQELISINNYASLIKYTIEGVTGSFKYEQDSQNSDIYVNIYGELIYKKNLTEDNLIITAEIEIYDVGVEHYEDIIGRIELTKITPDSNYLPIITYNKNIFSSYDKDPIQLTASLYRGGERLISGVSYNWRADSEAIKIEKIETDNVVEISRDQIVNVATIFCDCTVTSLGKTYTTQVTISDKTDPLFSQIISSKGLVFTGSDDVTELTCDIYRGTELINGTGSSFKYSWSYLQEGSIKFEPIVTESTSKTIEVIPQQINANSVTYRCEASNDVEKTIAQVAIIISPEFKAIVNPVQSFINTKHDGSLTNDAEIEIAGEKKKGFTRTILFKVVDEKGTVLDIINEPEIFPQIDLQAEEDNPFSFEWEKKEDKTWTINMTFVDISSEEEDYSFFAQRLANSTLFIIEYDYKNIQLSEEFYLIKNIQGEQGDEILSTTQEYSLGEYEEQNGFYYDKGSFKELDIFLEEESIIFKLINFKNNNKEYYLYISEKQQEDGTIEVLFKKDAADKILQYDSEGELKKDAKGNQIYFEDLTTRKLATLKILDEDGNEVADWTSDVPYIPFDFNEEEEEEEDSLNLKIVSDEEDSSEKIDQTKIIKSSLGGENVSKDFFISKIKHLSQTSLWIRDYLIWTDGSKTYSEPTPSEFVKDLKLSSSYSDILYGNNSIQTIVKTDSWASGILSNIGTLFSQTDSNFTFLFKKDETISSHIDFTDGNILLTAINDKNKQEETYATLIDNKGFYTLYIPENSQTKIKTGSFDYRGLSVKEISLKMNDSLGSKEKIVLSKGTPTGGWVWTKGSRRT